MVTYPLYYLLFSIFFFFNGRFIDRSTTGWSDNKIQSIKLSLICGIYMIEYINDEVK